METIASKFIAAIHRGLEKRRARANELNAKNRERVRAYYKERYAKKRAEIREYQRRYYHSLPKEKRKTEKQKADTRAWYQRNRTPERIAKARAKTREWQRVNKERLNKYIRDRRKTDLCFRLRLHLRSVVRNALSGKSKAARTLALLGCTNWQELRDKIASKFKPGMSWGNWGEWHIDHVRPLASADMSNPEDQKAVFHVDNLEPKWAVDNNEKASWWNGTLYRKKPTRMQAPC